MVPELLRVAVSIRSGAILPSDILRGSAAIHARTSSISRSEKGVRRPNGSVAAAGQLPTAFVHCGYGDATFQP
jgi:hypothetical protein